MAGDVVDHPYSRVRRLVQPQVDLRTPGVNGSHIKISESRGTYRAMGSEDVSWEACQPEGPAAHAQDRSCQLRWEQSAASRSLTALSNALSAAR